MLTDGARDHGHRHGGRRPAKRRLTVSVDQVEHRARARPRGSRSSRPCPRATAASSPSRCSPRSAWPRSCPGRPRGRSPSGAATGPTRRLARWRATAREAGQAGAARVVPRVAALATTDDVATLVGGADAGRRPARGRRRRLGDVAVPDDGHACCVVVGPEGGLTDDELAAFAAPARPSYAWGRGAAHLDGRRRGGGVALLARTPRWADRPAGLLHRDDARVGCRGLVLAPTRRRSARPGCRCPAAPSTGRWSTVQGYSRSAAEAADRRRSTA